MLARLILLFIRLPGIRDLWVTRAFRKALGVAGIVIFLISMWSSLKAMAAEPPPAPVEAAWLDCASAHGGRVTLDELQAHQAAVHQAQLADVDAARRRARRSSRLPEVLRVQTGARMDSDRENRLRLTQDFDALGAPSRSSLEDRDTFQRDMYVDVRISADWRLTRTRWADDEIALRREQTALVQGFQAARRSLIERWFALQQSAQRWCELRRVDAHYATDRADAPAREEPATLVRARLEVLEQLALLDALLDGALSEVHRARGAHR